uniref:Uncharacterized protein n=1 Tax=Arundo donax TaxID=35708 RepID=A0A0A9BJZ9_ARUDO
MMSCEFSLLLGQLG